MRWTPTALLLALAAATAHRAEATPGAEAVRAREAAQRILRRLDLQLGPSAGEPSPGRSGGNPLSRYAALSSADPSRIESTVDYARRTLAGTATARLTPESTIHFLRESAEEILTGPGSIPTAGASTAAHAADLRVIAALARFHARRLEAAIHYNLFLRGLRIAELVAATYVEKDAVELWRDVLRAVAAAEAAAAGDEERPLRLKEGWRDELPRLEASLRDLEEQCCPPDAAVLREKVWRLAPREALVAPVLEPRTPPWGDAGESSRFTVAARGAHGITSVHLRIRNLPSGGEYRTIPMSAGPDGTYGANLPAGLTAGAESLEYYFEAIGGNGIGTSFPEPDAAQPTLLLPLRR